MITANGVDKICNCCKQPLTVAAFGRDKSRKDGLNPRCKRCNNSKSSAAIAHNNYAAQRAYNARHPERSQKYYAKNVDKERQRSKEKYTRNTPYYHSRSKLDAHKRRALLAKVTVLPISAEDVARLVAAFAGKCAWCARPWKHIDHIQPLAKNGEHALVNLVPACATCNTRKHAKDPAVWAAQCGADLPAIMERVRQVSC